MTETYSYAIAMLEEPPIDVLKQLLDIRLKMKGARMIILHIEHPIRDFDTWKKAFESDPAGRERSGVRCYRILRPIDDPNYVMIDLEFENTRAAEALLAKMREVWQSAAASLLGGAPQTRIVEVVESKEF